jgi:ribosome maturation factor RimP
MVLDISKVVSTTVEGLGYELVDLERSSGGILRVFIDKVDGITVEDCATVSNQLTRVFTVENIDFERLEVSSPGLDRPLKTLQDFTRFLGAEVRVRLNTLVEERKRFDAIVEAVVADKITFTLLDESESKAGAKVKTAKRSNSKSKPVVGEVIRITVALGDIEKAKLIPDI